HVDDGARECNYPVVNYVNYHYWRLNCRPGGDVDSDNAWGVLGVEPFEVVIRGEHRRVSPIICGCCDFALIGVAGNEAPINRDHGATTGNGKQSVGGLRNSGGWRF